MAIDLKKFIARFVEEARDHLNRLNEGLATLAAGRGDAESINAIFRSAHTVKGSSRMLKLMTISETAHKLEDVLGGLREGSLTFSPSLGQLLQRAVDHLSTLVDLLAENGDAASLPAADAGLCAALAEAARSGNQTTPDQTTDHPVADHRTAPNPSAGMEIPGPSSADAAPAPASAPAPPALAPRLKTADTVRVKLAKLDELIKLMGEVVSSHARMRQRLADIQAIERMFAAQNDARDDGRLRRFARLFKDDVQAQEVLMDELHDKTLLMRMLPLAIVFEPAARLVRELASSVGKEVECRVSGAEIELDRQIIDKLADPIIHLIRNAIDHGIEPPARRSAQGKPPQGQLDLNARQDGGWVVIELTDDGAGIDLAAVRDKVVKKGLLSPEKAAALGEQEAIDLIFQPGFSTSPIITDLSGRGVGMDVVKQTILDDMQGVIRVTTRPGAGTTLALRLPLSLAVLRVLLVVVDGLPFGFTAQYVSELLRVPADALMNVAERNAIILRNEFVPVVPLTELLDIPVTIRPSERRNPEGRPIAGLLLIVLRIQHEKIAVQVDDLLDERDMVIKPLPAHMRQWALVSGMVITGANELVSVLHAPALLERARRVRGQRVQHEAARPAGDPHYRILVVDDSLNTREIEKDVLEAYGYEVTLAEDGMDGYRKATKDRFDAVLTDVEMPVMDGFTLTARLREEENYRHTPIIIITSREKEEDKRRGVEVGADAYIVKGDFDQSNLVDTLRSLLG